jgi:hypothetical protein
VPFRIADTPNNGLTTSFAKVPKHGVSRRQAADIAAFLSEQRYPPAKPRAVNTVKVRAAANRYRHYLAGLPSPTGTADVTETLAGISREPGKAGESPRAKLAGRISARLRCSCFSPSSTRPASNLGDGANAPKLSIKILRYSSILSCVRGFAHFTVRRTVERQ